MRPRHLALVLVLAVCAWLVPETADADLKLATFQVKGMV
jgi:hypothetical protein